MIEASPTRGAIEGLSRKIAELERRVADLEMRLSDRSRCGLCGARADVYIAGRPRCVAHAMMVE